MTVVQCSALALSLSVFACLAAGDSFSGATIASGAGDLSISAGVVTGPTAVLAASAKGDEATVASLTTRPRAPISRS
jgi:hypothetical protein